MHQSTSPVQKTKLPSICYLYHHTDEHLLQQRFSVLEVPTVTFERNMAQI